MTDEQAAATAVKVTIDNHRDEAWGLAQQYVMDRQAMTLDRIRSLKEAADLLAWASDGKGGNSYSLDNVG